MKNYDIARSLADTLNERKARDVVIIDIAEKSSFADYFINCTAGSERQLGALQADIEDRAAELGVEQKSVDGRPGTGWILMDYGDYVINIFTAETRERYSLDKVWGDCKTERIED